MARPPAAKVQAREGPRWTSPWLIFILPQSSLVSSEGLRPSKAHARALIHTFSRVDDRNRPREQDLGVER